MWFSANIRQRIASYALAVFMLQVIAVGFCVPTAVATTPQPVLEHAASMAGCMGTTKHTQSSMDAEACAHCDLPNLVLSLDKHQTSMQDMVFAVLYVQTFVLQAHHLGSTEHYHAPPLRTSLLTHDLNQRIRV